MVSNLYSSLTCTAPDTKCYDADLLNSHFITGDGRGNENIGLTAVHQIFHSEHNTVTTDIMNLLTGLDLKLTLPKWIFKASNNTKRISNVEGYSEIPLSRIREIERNL